METNKNKIIFYIIWTIFIFFIILLFIFINLWNWENNKVSKKWVLRVWTLFEDIKNDKIITAFKKKYPKYSSNKIEFQNFSNFEEYSYALTSAISKWKTPDIFVLNNNETSVFYDQVLWLSNKDIDINKFKKIFKTVFIEDLIELWSDKKTEYLAWIPLWYETLWVFYNKKFINNSQLKDLSTLNSAILWFDEDFIALWIWNWKIKFASDIATQFLLFYANDGGKSIKNLSSSQVKNGIWAYLNYAKFDSENNILDLFWNEEIYMLVWYPRFIKDIKNSDISEKSLFVEALPHPSWKSYTLANYNYLVMNKDSLNMDFAKDFLKFFTTQDWWKAFLEAYPYYLPALLSLENEAKNQKIDDDYNIVIWDFYNPNYELTSFDKWIKVFYDKWMKNVLNIWKDFYGSFDDFRDELICRTDKIINLSNLSITCEN